MKIYLVTFFSSKSMFRAGFAPLRLYATAQPAKPPLKLVAELRKLTEVSITKAREALIETNNDINAALEWLQKDLVTSGAKKAAKLEGRVAGEGLISVAVLSGGSRSRTGLGNGGLRAAMVELNCETDFVARNDLFGKLASDIAHTIAFISEATGSEEIFRPCILDSLKDAPLISPSDPHCPPSTVASAVRDLTAKVGERISLRRALAVVHNPQTRPDLGLSLATYVHGSVKSPLQGRIGTLAVLALRSPTLSSLLSSASFCEDLERLERSLGRQIVGFDTHSIRSPVGTKDESALYDQPFMMLAGGPSSEPVRTVLDNWVQHHGLVEKDNSQERSGLEVLDFAKWKVGEMVEAN
jgi:elongation factor Ts